MSTVTIELDLKVVQDLIHAKVQPAVDAVLATVDLPAMIEKALMKVPDRSASSMFGMGLMYRDPRPPIDEMVDDAIHQAARNYVENAVDRERLKLEAAFEKMLSGSTNKLAKIMVGALTEGLKNDWRFSIDTRVDVREPERLSHDD